VFLAACLVGDFAGGAAFSRAAEGYISNPADLYAGVEGVGPLVAPPAGGFPPLAPLVENNSASSGILIVMSAYVV
jgi:hypothetical protein